MAVWPPWPPCSSGPAPWSTSTARATTRICSGQRPSAGRWMRSARSTPGRWRPAGLEWRHSAGDWPSWAAMRPAGPGSWTCCPTSSVSWTGPASTIRRRTAGSSRSRPGCRTWPPIESVPPAPWPPWTGPTTAWGRSTCSDGRPRPWRAGTPSPVRSNGCGRPRPRWSTWLGSCGWRWRPGRTARRRQLAELYRKYGGDRERALAFARAARERLERLEQAEQEATSLEAELDQARRDLAEAERAVLTARRRAAPALAAATERQLAELALPGARLEVEVPASGAGDAVSFLFAANAGEALRPLARAASGGELARTMLALRLVAPGGPPTMVFDEVDAGVGGGAALALARALTEVSRQRQVLVVTHLAQVAAFATSHVSVRKVETNGRVSTTAEVVTGEDRVTEISRMLSGHPGSRRARAHAEELLDLAAQDRQPAPG